MVSHDFWHIRGENYSLRIERIEGEGSPRFGSPNAAATLRFRRERFDSVDECSLVSELKDLLFQAWYGKPHQVGLRGTVSEVTLDTEDCPFARATLEERLRRYRSVL